MQKIHSHKMNILNHLRSVGPSTGSQIQSLFFKDKSASLRNKVMDSLAKQGFVTSIRASTLTKKKEYEGSLLSDVHEHNALPSTSKVPGTIVFSGLNQREYIYFISKDHSHLMPDYTEKNSITFLGHQLAVTYIINFLKDYIDKKFMFTDGLFKEYVDNKPDYLGPIPDLLIFKNGVKLAIEVELTEKSFKRYLKKAEEYKYSDFDAIIYFCSSSKLISKIKERLNFNQTLYFSNILNPRELSNLTNAKMDILNVLQEVGVY